MLRGWDGMGRVSRAPDTKHVQRAVSGGFAVGCCDAWGHSSFFPSLPWLDGAVSHRMEGWTSGRWMLPGNIWTALCGWARCNVRVQFLQMRCFLVHVQTRMLVYISKTEVLTCKIMLSSFVWQEAQATKVKFKSWCQSYGFQIDDFGQCESCIIFNFSTQLSIIEKFFSWDWFHVSCFRGSVCLVFVIMSASALLHNVHTVNMWPF